MPVKTNTNPHTKWSRTEIQFLISQEERHCIFHSNFYKLKSIVPGKAIGLPDEFIASSPGSKGGGVIQVSITCTIFEPPIL